MSLRGRLTPSTGAKITLRPTCLSPPRRKGYLGPCLTRLYQYSTSVSWKSSLFDTLGSKVLFYRLDPTPRNLSYTAFSMGIWVSENNDFNWPKCKSGQLSHKPKQATDHSYPLAFLSGNTSFEHWCFHSNSKPSQIDFVSKEKRKQLTVVQ